MSHRCRDACPTATAACVGSILILGLLSACAKKAEEPAAAAAEPAAVKEAPEPAAAAPADANPLAGSNWRLVGFQSMDDSQGTTRPSDPDLYTLHLGTDGSANLKLNCNRAMGNWSAQAGADGSSGVFSFGPLAGTRALCPPPSMDEQFMKQAQYIRSYLLKDGHLFLSLMADGGIYEWEPTATAE